MIVLRYRKDTHKEAEMVAYYFKRTDGEFLEFIRPASRLQDPEHYTHLRPIWLPRQDQLQEMVDKNEDPIVLSCRFTKWVTGLTCLYSESWGERDPHNWSMEQLWLAFVMFEKYGKVWSGTEWIRDKNT